MAVSMIGPKFYAWDRNGKPLAFGKLYTYQARTNTPKDTYQSEDQVVPNTNPVILNGEGYANVYLDGSYKMVLKDDKENEIWSSNPVTESSADEWINCLPATYVSSSSFKVNGNFTAEYNPGKRVRVDNGASDYAYSTIQRSSFAGGETTVILVEPVVTTGVNSACSSIVGINSVPTAEYEVVESMKQAPLSIGMKVSTKGYSSSGDGGQSDYLIVASQYADEKGDHTLVNGNVALVQPRSGQFFIEQFGADNSGSADATPAILAALAKEVIVRAGPGTFAITDIALTANRGIYGAGKTRTTFVHTGAGAAFKAAGISTARNVLTGLTVSRSGAKDASVGFDLTDSSFCLLDDIQATGFFIGLIDNQSTGPTSFSARNTIRHYELNANTTGLLSEGGNTNSYLSGRIWGNTLGMDLSDTEALNFVGINMESNTTQVKGRNGAKATFQGGYIEAGGGNVNFDVDSSCHLDFYSPQINGDRGVFTVDPNNTNIHMDVPDTAASFAKFSIIPAADRQYIKNPDFSRALNNTLDSWRERVGISVSPQGPGRESGSRYVQLTATATGSKYVTSFKVERDVKRMALAVRYWQRSGTCRIQVSQNSVVLAQFHGSGVADTTWNTALIRIPALNSIDPDGGDLFVEIFPDIIGGSGRLDVDQVWCVKGDYVSTPRNYQQYVEMLRDPDLLVDKTLVSSNQIDNIAPADAPYNAIGMRLRVILQSEQATTVYTEYSFAGTNISIQPTKDATNVTAEVTIPAITAAGSLLITSGLNRATYKVELIGWILE